MRMLKRIVSAVFGLIIILQNMVGYSVSKAATIGESAYLQRAEKGFYSIQRWNGSQWIYITYSIVNYVDDDGVKRVAYCVNPELNGIGYIKGEYEGYDVQLKELLSNEKAWRVITNGYPYRTYEEMGVETEQDAYLATKMALYAMLRNQTEADIRGLFRAGENPVEGQHLEDIKRRGNKVIEAICYLVNIGNNGTETMQNNNILSLEMVGEFKEDNKDKRYCCQVAKVVSKVECKEYEIVECSNFPEGTIITDKENNKTNLFKGGDEFKILVPKTSITENIKGSIKAKGVCKNYPVYYAECKIGNYQNYLLCCDSYSKDMNLEADIEIKTKSSKLKITKIDTDTGSPIEGVKFSVKYKNGVNIGIFSTNEDGIIYLNNLHQGQVIVKEIETKNNYKLNNNEVVVNIDYNESKSITIKNEIKKGTINIVKIDKDDNSIRIKGVKFEIYNENDECIGTYITDENGEITVSNLPANSKYTIKEIETVKGYELTDDPQTVELSEGEIKTVIFENTKEKEEEKLPRTGIGTINEYLLTLVIITCLVGKKLLL